MCQKLIHITFLFLWLTRPWEKGKENQQGERGKDEERKWMRRHLHDSPPLLALPSEEKASRSGTKEGLKVRPCSLSLSPSFSFVVSLWCWSGLPRAHLDLGKGAAPWSDGHPGTLIAGPRWLVGCERPLFLALSRLLASSVSLCGYLWMEAN